MKDDPAEVILIMAWSVVRDSFIIIIDRFFSFLFIIYNAWVGGWILSTGSFII